jgi:hypothetical protein
MYNTEKFDWSSDLSFEEKNIRAAASIELIMPKGWNIVVTTL